MPTLGWLNRDDGVCVVEKPPTACVETSPRYASGIRQYSGAKSIE